MSICPALSFRPSSVWLIVLAAISFGAVANPGSAFAVPGPNQTVLTLDPVIVGALKVAKVKVVPVGAAQVGSAGLYFPVTNANMTDGFVGYARHQGGFELRAGTLRAGFRNITVKTKAGSSVTGSLSAEPVIMGFGIPFQLPLSNLTIDSVQVRSPGVVARYSMRIDKALAKLINGALHIKVLVAGQKWATLETRIARGAAPATTVPTTPAPDPIFNS